MGWEKTNISSSGHIAPRIPPYGRFITMISAGHPAVPMYYRIPSFAL